MSRVVDYCSDVFLKTFKNSQYRSIHGQSCYRRSFSHARITKMLKEAKIIMLPNMASKIEKKSKNCKPCMSSGENLEYQIPKNHYGNLQIYFTGKLNYDEMSVEKKISTGIGRFNKRPTVKICKTTKAKAVKKSLSSKFQFTRITENN